jgi:phosphatidate phosphatase
MEYRFIFRQRFVYLINFLAICSFGVGSYFIEKIGRPFMQGFYCDDDTINHPYNKPLIPPPCDLIAAAFVLVVSCCIVEFIHIDEKWKILYDGTNHLKTWANDVFYTLLFTMYGSGMTIFVTSVTKYMIGRPAPHFLDICRPNWRSINCTNEWGQRNYIVGDAVCMSNDLAAIQQARLSFPDSHASFLAFVATFVVLYVEFGVRPHKWGSIPKLFVQSVVGSAALFVGLSSVADNSSHVGDVLAGYGIGVSIGIAVYNAYKRELDVTKHTGICKVPDDEH